MGNARLVQFGLGGMLLRGGQLLPVGKRVTAKILAADYPYEVEVPAEVVGVRNALMAFKFLAQPGQVRNCRAIRIAKRCAPPSEG